MRSLPCFFRSVCQIAAAFLAFSAAAAEFSAPKPAGVSLDDDPLSAARKFRVAPGLKVDLVAAEPLIQNVVSFAFDERGRIYVVETGRRRTSVFDIRNHKSWVDADLSFRTVEDRANFLKKHTSLDEPDLVSWLRGAGRGGFGDLNRDGAIDWRDLEVESERIRLLTDFDHNGRAVKAVTFADGFNSLVSGVAAGVLTRKGQVWFACIPDLWLLQDLAGTGEATLRASLHRGFGVHIAYGGHDMHGLKFGPDGKIYWSIADRGTHVVTREGKTIALPDTGAVFRANPDGSDMEVVATGLRNPQELAFDEHGNLFTGDNNADGGDKARFEYIVEGADFGWRYGWQHLPKLGAWNSERLWGLAATNTAAYVLPPVAHITHGPAGLAYYPGTGMPERYARHFFLADFPGGVRTFASRPVGASFTVDNPGDYLQDNSPEKPEGKLLWNLYPVDVDFGPAGGAYVLDWVTGWEKTGKGRLWRVHDPALDRERETVEVKDLLADMERPIAELADLLGHRDQRVRQAAQFALVEASGRKVWRRGLLEVRLTKDEALLAMREVARAGKSPLGRLHAIWGLGQLHRLKPETSLSEVRALLRDAEPEVRAQAAKVLGEARHVAAVNELVWLTRDDSPRVRFFAAMALGKLGRLEALQPILAMLRTNDDRDAYLRHAGVMALVGLNDVSALNAAAKDRSASVRLASLLAMRRLALPQIAGFLDDPEPRLVLEAARAINDVPIESATPALANLLRSSRREEALASPSPLLGGGERAGVRGVSEVVTGSAATADFTLRRAINAAFRLGTAEHARALAELAGHRDAPAAARAEALAALSDWPAPSGRDRITGLWRPVPPRDASLALAAFAPAAEQFLSRACPQPDAVRIAAASAVEKLGVTNNGATLFELFLDTEQKVDVRLAALRALAGTRDTRLAGAVKVAQTDSAEAVRREASRLAGSAGSATDAVATLAGVLQRGSSGEKQAALQALGALASGDADALLSNALDDLLAGRVPPELQLDLLEAAAKRRSDALREKLQKFEAARDPQDPLAKWQETLFGGDAKAGRQIFYERAEAGCFRCHKVNGEGGDVGPELAGLVAKRGRDYALESLVLPNKQIAPGFESLLVTMKSGATFAGLLKSETGDELVLNSPEDGILKLKKSEVAKRAKGLSPMPEGLGDVMSKRDLRDLIEFLSTAK